jgi:transposase
MPNTPQAQQTELEVPPISRTLFSLEKECEMPTPKPPYPAAFRQQMVELVRGGRRVSDLARKFGCNASSIYPWVKAAVVKGLARRGAV